MKDFDDERSKRDEWPEESFKIAGRTFRLKPQMPIRALSMFIDMQLYTTEKQEMPMNVFGTLRGVVRDSIRLEDQEAWDELTEAELANPLTMEDLMMIGNHIASESAKRPTSPFSASGTTAENGGTKLTVASDLPAEPAPTVSTSEVG